MKISRFYLEKTIIIADSGIHLPNTGGFFHFHFCKLHDLPVIAINVASIKQCNPYDSLNNKNNIKSKLSKLIDVRKPPQIFSMSENDSMKVVL